MTPYQRLRYNELMAKRKLLSDFIYVSGFADFVNNGILLDAAVELAKKAIEEIDKEIERL